MMYKHKNTLHAAKAVFGCGALLFLAIIAYRDGFQEIAGIPYALATKPTCEWWNVICHLDHWIIIPILKFVLSLLTFFLVGPLWFALIVSVRLIWWLIYEVVVATSSLFAMLSVWTIKSAILPNADIAQALLYRPALLNAIHAALWIPVRDLVHVGFALLLIAGAIITIVKANKDIIAQYGPKFMVAIILVNFSWFIPRLVLDVANVAAVASFSLAQCPDCKVIKNIYLSNPELCVENATNSCPTFFVHIEKGIVSADDDAAEAMGALFGPFDEILSIRVLPRVGGIWERISKLFVIYNSTSFTQEAPFPNTWTGIGNILECIWAACTPPPLTGPFVRGEISTSQSITLWVNAVISMFSQAVIGTIRMMLLILLAAIFLVLYVFAIIALMLMVLLRIPIIWLTLGFMPVVALGFVIGRGGSGGLLWGVWDKFVGAAFIPAAIGIPIAAGSAILNAARSLTPNVQSTGLVADLFGIDGITQILFIIVSLVMIWMGVFFAITSLQNAGLVMGYMGNVAGRVQKLGQGAAIATGYTIASKAPVLPIGNMLKGLALGSLLGMRTLTVTGRTAALAGKTAALPFRGRGGPGTPPPESTPPSPQGGKPSTPPPKELVGRTIDIDGARAHVDKVSDDGKKAYLTGSDGTKYEAPMESLNDAKILEKEEETKTTEGEAPAGGASPPAPTKPEGGIGEEVRTGARAGVIEGLTGKKSEEEAAAPIEGIPAVEKGKTEAVKPGGSTPGERMKAFFGPSKAEQKVVGWTNAAGAFLGQKLLPGIGKVAKGTREKVGNVLGIGSSLQKSIMSTLFQAGSGKLDSVLHEWAGSGRSLGEMVKQRLKPSGIGGDDAEKAAKKLGSSPQKGRDFIDATKALAINPIGSEAYKAANRKMIEILESLKKEGIPIDTSKGLGGITRAIIDAGQKASTPLQSQFNSINAIDLEWKLNDAAKAATSGPGSGSPPPTSPPPPPSGGTP